MKAGVYPWKTLNKRTEEMNKAAKCGITKSQGQISLWRSSSTYGVIGSIGKVIKIICCLTNITLLRLLKEGIYWEPKRQHSGSLARWQLGHTWVPFSVSHMVLLACQKQFLSIEQQGVASERHRNKYSVYYIGREKFKDFYENEKRNFKFE